MTLAVQQYSRATLGQPPGFGGTQENLRRKHPDHSQRTSFAGPGKWLSGPRHLELRRDLCKGLIVAAQAHNATMGPSRRYVQPRAKKERRKAWKGFKRSVFQLLP